MVMLFLLTSSSISCPSCLQVLHFTQGHDGISPSFWGPNWLIASQHRPLQFPTDCKMLAKCCINLFCCHQCQTVVGFFIPFFLLLTPSGVDTLYSCFRVRNPRPTNTRWYYGRTEFKRGNFSFMIPSRSTARRKRESISTMYASITEECAHSPVCGSIGVLGCGLTAGILQKVTSILQTLKGMLAWDNREAWNMPAVCNCTSLHALFLFCFVFVKWLSFFKTIFFFLEITHFYIYSLFYFFHFFLFIY